MISQILNPELLEQVRTLYSEQKFSEGIDLLKAFLAKEPGNADACDLMGRLLGRVGKLVEALPYFDQAIALSPATPSFHFDRGVALRDLRGHREARPSFERAVELDPNGLEAVLAAAGSNLAEGNAVRGITLAMQAVKIAETAETRSFFAKTVLQSGMVADNEELKKLIVRAITEAWIAPRLLFNAGAVIIRNGPSRAHIERAAWSWPKTISETGLSEAGPLSRVYSDQPLLTLLKSVPFSDPELEKFLTLLRQILLEKALKLDRNKAAPEELVSFASALAQQCYVNEYVFRVEKNERAETERLFRIVKLAAKKPEPLTPLMMAAAACYSPLEEICPSVPMEHDWPAAIREIIRQQIIEPREIRKERDTITWITPIENQVSQAVRQQYEENPYPRWMNVPVTPHKDDLYTELKAKLPYSRIEAPAAGSSFEVLIAGCGTGQQLPEFSGFPHAKVLAVDLSLASLAYAKSKSAELGLKNIEFGQADILDLKLPERSFDLIVSTGVLHHMENPEAGWRKLVSLLKPNGLMLIGLYSELARRNIVAARAEIAARKFRANANSIRQFRQDVLNGPNDPALKQLLRAPDFYNLSECRDLLFHVQEHRFTIPRIGKFLAENGLVFLGLENTLQAGRELTRYFTLDKHYADLDKWHAFELEHPDTFVAMYNFWVQKTS